MELFQLWWLHTKTLIILYIIEYGTFSTMVAMYEHQFFW